MIVSIWSMFEDFFGGIRDFVIKQDRNPVFWTLVVIGGIAVFAFTYSALHKD